MSDYRGTAMPGSSGRQYQPVYLPPAGPVSVPQPRPQLDNHEDIVALEHEVEYYKEQLEHSEIQRECIQNQLDTARAQARHDGDMIAGLQARIKELEEMLRRHGIEGDAKTSSMPLIDANPDAEEYVDPNSGNGNGSSLRRMSTQGSSDVSPTTRYLNVFGQPPPRFNLQVAAARAGDSEVDGASQAHFSLHSNATSGAGTGTGTGSGSRATPSSPEEQIASFVSLIGREPQQVIHMQDPPFSPTDFANRLIGLWTTSKCFAMKYTNTTFMYDENAVGQNVRVFLNLASDRSTELLSDVSTRFLMVSKAINWFIAKTVLKTSVVSGFDPNVDSEIKQMATHLNSSTPHTVKNAMIRGIGQHVLVLRNRPLFDNFYNKRTHEHTQHLFQLLSPLIFSRDPEAWCELGELMVDAHGLALAMYSGPYEFKFVHPLSHHYFDPKYMTDHNAGTDEDWGMQQAKRKYTVKLAITPVPFFRNAILQPEAPLQVLHLGDVILGPEVGHE
ncbi:uncharacterized protein GIQ15_03873 [Arthroderma uncinatum]|uniref:uncharacterized protein n=1 Tax=Arthroderma uncinatum TaxID=74035 RepID=UPI00144A9CCE|nr:uncharacterized protein GIQ15_03873 [Arthroderma uncinatum]KAF3481114.1 hypothetical protein GIQ15_03873 [Arthroderma uncinatum]